MTNNVTSLIPALDKKREDSEHKAHQALLRNNYAFGFRINYCRALHQQDFHFGYVFLNQEELDTILERASVLGKVCQFIADPALDHLVYRDHLLFYSVGSLEENGMGHGISEALEHASYSQIPLEYDFKNKDGERPFRYQPKYPELLISPGTIIWRSYEPSGMIGPDGEQYPPQPIYSDPIPIETMKNIRDSMD